MPLGDYIAAVESLSGLTCPLFWLAGTVACCDQDLLGPSPQRPDLDLVPVPSIIPNTPCLRNQLILQADSRAC